MQKSGKGAWVLAQQYYTQDDPENVKNLILILLKNYAGINEIKKVPAPKHQPPFGLYAPQQAVFKELKEYKKNSI